MLRRDFISFLAGALVAGSRVAIAQTPSKVYRVGTLLPGAPVDEKSPLGAILLKKLEQHGYTLGKNLAYEARGAGGQVSKLGEIVNSMKANGVDVIVAGGFPTTLACKVANVPTVVFLGAGDPVATRLIDSLAHPGGNITGISDNAAALATKRLELIKQAVPKVRRVAMLWNRNDLGMSMRYDASADAARSLGVTVQALGVREPDDFIGVFEAMDRDPPDAIFMVEDSLTTLNRKRMFDYAGATIFQPSTNTMSPMCMTAA
jgi:putative ABC transport system substrate-binding protein